MTIREDKMINIAICGCGRIAAAHMDVLRELEGVRVSAYWNRPEEKALAKSFLETYGGDYACEDFARIADDPKIDAVYLCTMHNDRIRLVETFAKAGKAIFSEKPLTHNPESLIELGEVLKRHDALFWSGYKIRFHTLFQKAMELVPRPELLSAHVMDEIWPEGILQNPEIGGGNVLSQGVYATESIRLMAGSAPIAVSAVARFKRHGGDVPDSLCASFEFENGAIGSVTVGDAGLAPEGVSKFQVVAAGENKCVTITNRFETLSFQDTNSGASETIEHPEDGFKRQSEAFIAAVRGKGELISDFTQGALPSIMIYKALEAARSGRKVLI